VGEVRVTVRSILALALAESSIGLSRFSGGTKPSFDARFRLRGNLVRGFLSRCSELNWTLGPRVVPETVLIVIFAAELAKSDPFVTCPVTWKLVFSRPLAMYHSLFGISSKHNSKAIADIIETSDRLIPENIDLRGSVLQKS
jgi:hypothetical protein